MRTIGSVQEHAPLTASGKKAAEYAAAGSPNPEIARKMGIRPGSVSRLLSDIGRAYGGGLSRPARIHIALTAHLIDQLLTTRCAPDFTDAELRLLRAVAEHSLASDIAAAAGLAESDLKLQTNRLVGKAKARDVTHLVGLGHTWQLLGPAHAPGDPR